MPSASQKFCFLTSTFYHDSPGTALYGRRRRAREDRGDAPEATAGSPTNSTPRASEMEYCLVNSPSFPGS